MQKQKSQKSATGVFDLNAARAYVPIVQKQREEAQRQAKKVQDEVDKKARRDRSKLLRSIKASIPEIFNREWVPQIQKAIQQGLKEVRILEYTYVVGSTDGMSERERILWDAAKKYFMKEQGYRVEMLKTLKPDHYGREVYELSFFVSGW